MQTHKQSHRQFTMKSAGVTDIGRVRSHNHDTLSVDDELVIVADGMGRGADGRRASQLAVDTVRSRFRSERSVAGLVAGIHDAHRALLDVRRTAQTQAADGDTGHRPNTGTTVAAIGLSRNDSGQQMVVANVGDSRVYLWRHGRLHQLSVDHSMVNDLVRVGEIAERDVVSHPDRHRLTQAVGTGAMIAPHVMQFAPRLADRMLVCSDGLVTEVPTGEIERVLSQVDDRQAAAQRLVDIANENGGGDNTAVVVADIGVSDAPDDTRAFDYA